MLWADLKVTHVEGHGTAVTCESPLASLWREPLPLDYHNSCLRYFEGALALPLWPQWPGISVSTQGPPCCFAGLHVDRSSFGKRLSKVLLVFSQPFACWSRPPLLTPCSVRWSFRSCRSHPPVCPQVQTRPKPSTSAQDCSTVSGTPGRLPWLTHLSLRRQSIVWNCVLGEQKMSKLQPVQVDLGTSLQRAARLCLLPLCCSSWKWDTGAKIPGNPRPPSARTQRQQDLILSCYRLANRLGRKHSILRDSLAWRWPPSFRFCLLENGCSGPLPTSSLAYYSLIDL